MRSIVIEAIFIGYEALTVLLPLIIVFAVLNRVNKKHGRQNSLRRFLMLCAFAVYIFATLHFTGAGTIFNIFRNITNPHYSGRFSLVPFVNGIDIAGCLLNILLFVPLGFLVPLLWPQTDKFKYALLAGLSLLFFIEISQFFGYRLLDIDDLIANTAGALLGHLMYGLFARITKWKSKQLNHPKYEPFFYLAAMFLGHFLLYDSPALRALLFGSDRLPF